MGERLQRTSKRCESERTASTASTVSFHTMSISPHVLDRFATTSGMLEHIFVTSALARCARCTHRENKRQPRHTHLFQVVGDEVSDLATLARADHDAIFVGHLADHVLVHVITSAALELKEQSPPRAPVFFRHCFLCSCIPCRSLLLKMDIVKVRFQDTDIDSRSPSWHFRITEYSPNEFK